MRKPNIGNVQMYEVSLYPKIFENEGFVIDDWDVLREDITVFADDIDEMIDRVMLYLGIDDLDVMTELYWFTAKAFKQTDDGWEEVDTK